MRQLFKTLVLSVMLIGGQAHAAKVFNISQSAESVSPLMPGLKVPSSQIATAQGDTLSTDALFASKPTVLVVYRGGWCPYCNQQLKDLQKIETDLVKLGFQLIAMSPDSAEKLAQNPLESKNYRLISDFNFELTQNLGLGYYLDEKMSSAYKNKLGATFVGLDGKAQVALPVPAVFVIDQTGLVHFQYANPNYRVRLDESVLLAAAKAMPKA